jgi:hypothetical protein
MKKATLSVVVGLAGVAAWVGGASAPLWSQTHKVTSPDSVVRAVGVYEWTGDIAKPTGSRFVPVTVFINGELQDGGIYLPRPIPFALLTGNVYELEDAGLGKGTVVLETAMKATTPDEAPSKSFIEGWTAYGSYKAPPAERKSTATLRPSKNLPVITTSGGDPNKPHFSNKSDTAKSGDADKPADQKSSPASTTDTASSQQKADDPDRPTMRRRTSDDTSSTTTSTASSAGDSTAAPATAPHTSSDDDKAERPTLKRRSPEDAAKDAKDQKEKKKGDIATVTGPASLNDDPDRPTLKHGSKSTEDMEMPKLMGVPPDMKQMVAVSDAKNRPSHPFARPWEDPTERAAILAKMQAFARTKLTDYGIVPGVTPPQPLPSTAVAGKKTAASGSTSTPAASEGSGPPKLKRGIPTDDTTEAPSAPATASKPAASGSTDPGPPTLKRGIPPSTTTATKSAPASTTAHKTGTTTTAGTKGKRPSKGPATIELADEELKGYLLSYGGAPTYVYMARTVETGSVMRYVTILAQDDGMGQLKIALASVTDATHLDRTPWMRLVDVVDVEASNRASLLFELRGNSSRQFALYRVIAAKPEQIFATSM